jgi:Family of unknown function (DUF6169)
LLSPYPLKENDEYSFEFVTDQGIRYVIYFLDYSSMFADYPEIAKQVFMFNIDVIEGNPDVGVSDERIGHTVLKVFNLFFQKSQNVAVYVCDTIDERHLSRKRKFDIWFWKFNDGSLLKEDDIAVIDDVEIYNSIILHKKNDRLWEIVRAYKDLNEKASGK